MESPDAEHYLEGAAAPAAAFADSSGRVPYSPIPAGFWLAVIFLLISLAGLAVGITKSLRSAPVTTPLATTPTRNTTPLPVAVELQSATIVAQPPRGGPLALFYRGSALDIPFRVEMLRGALSFRGDHEWAHLPQQNISARLTARLLVPEEGTYRFFVDANDGARVYVNGEKIFDDWNCAAIGQLAGDLVLPQGAVPLVIEWHNKELNGWLGLWWESQKINRQPIPAEALIPDLVGLPTAAGGVP